MHQRSTVFDETYRRYLAEIRQIDFLAKAGILGVSIEDGALRIPLYNRVYRFAANGLVGEAGEDISPAIQVMICKYILTCPREFPAMSDALMTYRDFKGAAPLVSYFTTNTNKTLEATFSGDVAGLRKRGQEIGGRPVDSSAYDLSLEFHAFPRVPVILNFNDRDELFPATCSILYRASAEYFLDMECLAMTGTLLAGKLIAPRESG